MSFIRNILGPKKPTTVNLALELEAKQTKLADADRRIAAAASARQAAIEKQDKDALILADAAKLDAEQDVALATAAIAALQAAHADAAAQEDRDAFRRAVDDHRRAAARLTERIKSEYPSAAMALEGSFQTWPPSKSKTKTFGTGGRHSASQWMLIILRLFGKRRRLGV
ncbi:hypothetical protein [Aureimonas psammosilenae]|uniref:hypothetical protein n=1 Tax=Aureimonas psammosilenae TaxID=2495496 RepID=UPI001260C3F2|nr:hypothetical protein [Aureimonas psammosilenae]